MAKTKDELIRKRVDQIIEDYSEKRIHYANAAKRLIEDLSNDAPLNEFVHSTKFRSKEPKHLKDKLLRKASQLSAAKKPFSITKKNYEEVVEDLGGCRLLHIHTKQILEIHPRILEVLEYHNYEVIGDPTSYTWDIEGKKIFEGMGINVVEKESFYTSTHYIIKSPGFPARCELQVRTLAEELWGEVSHSINYPRNTGSIACKEQLMALARFTSGCSRLVDSLYASKAEFSEPSEDIG